MEAITLNVPTGAIEALVLEAIKAELRAEFAASLTAVQSELEEARVEITRLAIGENTAAKWLDAEAAARYAGCSTQRIYDLKSAGRLDSSGCDGRKPLFTRDDLDRYFGHGLPHAA